MLSRHIHPLTIWFQKESCPFEVRNLQVLRLSGLEFSQMIDLVQYVGENLSELQIMSLQLGDLNNYFEYTPNLRILHLGNLWQTDSYIPVPIIQALFGRFNNQDSKFPIRHLTIVLRPQHIEPSETRHWDQWAAIDVLLQKPKFARLETVHFQLFQPLKTIKIGGRSVGPITSDILELLRKNLPCLQKSGKLTVEMVNNVS
ncbi:hypothetical protein BT96DRAFT_1004582 [Gymnopus androsaceus JB14]|uniref:F-box domain-containing protein n=1 Tax=Gymnopus androsaceus JB14 TaxID=1447944 RepID=A0A6A4GQG1_9AGAR|nr:hypothetical protein BT96DRAFT_1004582 [Gymnopus androsaceus JB14]